MTESLLNDRRSVITR